MKKNYKGEILFTSISMFIVICIWVGSDIYNKSVMNTLDKTLQKQTIPIPPSFEMDTVEKIKSRVRVVPNYKSSGKTIASESATILPTISEEETTASSSGEGRITAP